MDAAITEFLALSLVGAVVFVVMLCVYHYFFEE
jgi:hypothetical protein